MTHTASGSSPGVPRAWLLSIAVLLGIVLFVALGWLSRSVVIDFVAWWPVWLFIGGLTLLARRRRWGQVRIAALVPLLALAALGIFLVCHLLGWDAMPSASASLVGPGSDSVSTAAISARIEERLEVGLGQSGFLYAVAPIRTGGDTGLPEAVERAQGASMAVVLEPVAEPGWYTFSGWSLELDPSPAWALSLGGVLSADLTPLRITELQLEGEGSVRLGNPMAETPVSLSGAFEIEVPSGSAVRVVGSADVPEGWTETSDGWESPSGAGGWVVSVTEGSTLAITEG
ncbi:MAG TPA: hypothetical protein VI980_03100 [Acidimicrobiia bacterium]|nr:hypothetical protein [Acidimicrobiia bacterium]HLF60150.1 hypothetical protein [Acidimicrobiia bacterium]